ncbi:MAG: cytochrome b/b6 domain-containing protein [Beijerinckiaceae bacterium]|jgi:cytochrome b|nr:cytochrome b/b6 domain-containing protein [Beijerinckiaceae bacterium]
MAIGPNLNVSGAQRVPETVKVWDVFVRVFHWSLVTLFVAAFFTPDFSEKIHQGVGYAIAVLLAARIIWGFIGSPHARFSDFVRGPRETAQFLRDTLYLRAKRYRGHNPAGGAMDVALIVSISGTCLSGYLMTLDYFWGMKWIEEVHEVCAWGCVALIFLHVLGVIVASFEHKEFLIWSMFTGQKRKD